MLAASSAMQSGLCGVTSGLQNCVPEGHSERGLPFAPNLSAKRRLSKRQEGASLKAPHVAAPSLRRNPAPQPRPI
jgi:hypothetical protein